MKHEYLEKKRYIEKTFPYMKHMIIETSRQQLINTNKKVIARSQNYCVKIFGFAPDTKGPLHCNKKLVLGNTNAKEYFNEWSNFAFCDTNIGKHPNLDLISTLRLGLKFFPQSRKIPQNNVTTTIDRFKRSIRIENFVQNRINLGKTDNEPRPFK